MNLLDILTEIASDNTFNFKVTSKGYKGTITDEDGERKDVYFDKWEIKDTIGGRAYGYIEGDNALIIGMTSSPLGTSYGEMDKFKRRGFLTGIIDTLKKNGIKSIQINIQSSDTRNAMKRLIDKGVVKNPRLMRGISVDEHPSKFDISENK